MKRQCVRVVLSDDIATWLPMMRTRYALALRAHQRRNQPQFGAGEGTAKTLTWSDGYSVTPLHQPALN